MSTEPFVCESLAEVHEAVRHFRAGPAGFADYLILGRATRLGAGTLLTFDKRLARDSGCEVP